MKSRFAALAALALLLALPAQAQVMVDSDAGDDATPMMPMPPMAPPAGVRKISDAGLTCEQIHAEARSQEEAMARHRAAVDAAQREANTAQDAMMKRAAGGSAMPVASSLLSLVPGAGMFSGVAAQAAMSARQSALQEGTAQLTAAYQRIAALQEQMAYAQARNDHLVGLFLDRKCKLPEGAAPQVAPAQ